MVINQPGQGCFSLVRATFRNVIVVDGVPAGLEAQSTTGVVPEKVPRWWAQSYYPDPSRCDGPQVQNERGVVQWKCNYLKAGQTELVYYAMSNVKGLYASPPTHAYSEDDPALMGLSKGQLENFLVQGDGNNEVLLYVTG